jgi:hypothetical protein
MLWTTKIPGSIHREPENEQAGSWFAISILFFQTNLKSFFSSRKKELANIFSFFTRAGSREPPTVSGCLLHFAFYTFVHL